jgi:hypothetical protein
VNNQSYEKVKYVHAYVDIYLTKKGEEEKKRREFAVGLIITEKKEEKENVHTHKY